MQTHRIARVQELLKREIGEILRRQFTVEEVGVLSVNAVEISKDLQNASVFVGMVGTDEQRKRAALLLAQERKRIQGIIGRSVVLKYTPQLRFVLDESVSRGNRVLEIIEEIERSSPPHEGKPEDH